MSSMASQEITQTQASPDMLWIPVGRSSWVRKTSIPRKALSTR